MIMVSGRKTKYLFQTVLLIYQTTNTAPIIDISTLCSNIFLHNFPVINALPEKKRQNLPNDYNDRNIYYISITKCIRKN